MSLIFHNFTASNFSTLCRNKLFFCLQSYGAPYLLQCPHVEKSYLGRSSLVYEVWHSIEIVVYFTRGHIKKKFATTFPKSIYVVKQPHFLFFMVLVMLFMFNINEQIFPSSPLF